MFTDNDLVLVMVSLKILKYFSQGLQLSAKIYMGLRLSHRRQRRES